MSEQQVLLKLHIHIGLVCLLFIGAAYQPVDGKRIEIAISLSVEILLAYFNCIPLTKSNVPSKHTAIRQDSCLT